MAKCHENRKARKRRRRRQQRQDERRALECEQNGWLCQCGNWIEDGLHCPMCGMEPPWGCGCSYCEDRDDEEHEDYLDEMDFFYEIEGELDA
jgi:hypothetical protein